ncbi:polysaccharide deacetylase family protein [Paenibacillus oenotherae]|uniref:Polysaccharide deacetylase family protein n=2 Tax=Paenibacillus oenotherae TaxID=1435645 RepID=A0ABS7D371_9BACL|nr:polysaccharide deacetylase family protein [Paenibacillus oenotherae]
MLLIGLVSSSLLAAETNIVPVAGHEKAQTIAQPRVYAHDQLLYSTVSASSSEPHSKQVAAEARRKRHNRKPRRQKRNNKKAAAISWVTLQQWYPGSFVIGGPRNIRKVALTFDDVPDPRYTPKVLEILARYRVRATFFVVGSRAVKHPAIVRRMRREGHIIGNHSYDHAVFSRISLSSFQQQIMRTDAILRPLAGHSPRLVRPPYGEILPGQIEWLRSRGFIVVNWDVDSVDWRGINSNSILINIKKTLQPGSIILQHAGGGAGQDLTGTIKALPRLIKLLQDKGYEIVPLPELINKPAARNTAKK